MYTHKIANIFDHIQDLSRLGLENKFLENKSGLIFLRSRGLLYKFLQQIWGCLNTAKKSKICPKSVKTTPHGTVYLRCGV